jgi:hypothetical protein
MMLERLISLSLTLLTVECKEEEEEENEEERETEERVMIRIIRQFVKEHFFSKKISCCGLL